MKKLILIVIDGLGYEVAKTRMAYLQHLVEYKKATFHKVIGELPTLSRPMYETILTGLPVIEHGIVSNDTVRLSRERNVFKIARENGLTTAAAAYHWISELYVKAPFDRFNDRILKESNSDIQNGIFYWSDSYPDEHLYYDAEYLRKTYKPDFLYIHPMNVDDASHSYSGNSANYRNSVLATDQSLANLLPVWMEDGYTIMVTADHGANDDNGHGGTLPCEREVPLWIIGEENLDVPATISQLQIAPLVCNILEIK